MSDFFIAQIGRTVGLWGDLKFHLHTDFPQQFQAGVTFKSSRGDLTIQEINLKRGIIRFTGFEDLTSAKTLTNVKLFSSLEQTKKNCELEDGQHFWFDVIGCKVQENDEILGEVLEIQRLLDTDYLSIQTTPSLVEEGLPKNFLLPYIDRYILKCDVELKIIDTQDAKSVLEAS